ncbi:hypothetical protein lerEdw1_012317 [Lerista edwardsae]|nr:hypothetical protein lerEdw1_012317 [Lerista edwardsae]
MGNFIGARTSQTSTGDTNQVEEKVTVKPEEANGNTEDGPGEENPTEALLRMASDFSDKMEQERTLMSHVRENQDLLKPQLHAILEELYSKDSPSSEEPSQQKEAHVCLIVLGTTFSRRTLNFLVKKMDEVWKDTVLVLHTINILKAVVHSNGLPPTRDFHEGLAALDYRQGLLTKLLFLEETIFQISDELWVNYFVQSLILQLSYCSPHEKNFIYKCWGVAMKASLGTLIEPSLWRIVQGINFEETQEREGFAYALGICATHHQEEVIYILEEYQNYVDELSNKCYLMQGAQVSITTEQMRSVLLLSYYFVAFLAPTKMIFPIMPGIFSRILQNYPYCLTDPLVKSAFTDSVILMCQAAVEKNAECSLESRRLAVIYLKNILLEPPECCLEIENLQKATKAITRLVNMNRQKPTASESTQIYPWLMENLQQAEKSSTELAAIARSKDSMALSDSTGSTIASQKHELSNAEHLSWSFHILETNHDLEVLDLCISCIMRFPPWDSLENTEHFAGSFTAHINWDSLEMREDIADNSVLQRQMFYHKTFEVVYEIIRTLMEWHMELDTLNSILKIQEPIKNAGRITGLLLPRCVENLPGLYHWGMAAVACLLNAPGSQKIEITAMESLRILNDEKKCVPTITVFKAAMLVVNFLPADELMQFIRSTLEAMLQNEIWAEAIADILKMVIHHKATELQDRVEILIHIMYDILDSSDAPTVKKAVRSTVGALAYVEPKTMVTALLTFPWLDLSEIRALWRSLIANRSLFSIVLPILLNKIPEKYQERTTSHEKPNYLPDTIADVLWEFVAAVKRKELLEEKKEALFYYCFLSIPGASTKQLMDINEDYRRPSSFLSIPVISTQSTADNSEGHRMPSFSSLPGTSTQNPVEITRGYRNFSPCSKAVQALQNILKLGGCEPQILVSMDEDHGWELMADDREQHRGFAAFGRVMRNCCPGVFPRTVVQDFLSGLYFHKEVCWTDCVAFFAEFVGSTQAAKDEQKMMLDVYNVMKLFIYNGNPIIIMYGMRGISNAIHMMPKKEKKTKENILGIFLRSLSKPWDPNIKQEAISGISKLLPYFSSIETSTSIQLAQQAQNCFDDEDPYIRQKALEIFGQQSQYFNLRNDTYCELVEKHLAHILIHLQDDDPEVAKAAEVTLWKCAPFVRIKRLRNLILNFLHKEDHKITNSFIMEVSRLLVEDHPGRLGKTLTTRAVAACELMGMKCI